MTSKAIELVAWGLDEETGGRVILDIIQFRRTGPGGRGPKAWRALMRLSCPQATRIERRARPFKTLV